MPYVEHWGPWGPDKNDETMVNFYSSLRNLGCEAMDSFFRAVFLPTRAAYEYIAKTKCMKLAIPGYTKWFTYVLDQATGDSVLIGLVGKIWTGNHRCSMIFPLKSWGFRVSIVPTKPIH